MNKILLVTKNMAGDGAERVIKYLIDALIAKGINTHLALLEKKTIFYDIPESCLIHEVEQKHKNRIKQKIYSYKFIRKLCKRERFDLVFSMPEEIGIYLAFFLIGIKTPIVVSERNDPWRMPNKKITRFLRHISYLRVNGLIFQTKKAQSFFGDRIIKKSIVLKNPIDLGQFAFGENDNNSKTIVSVGRLEPQKNHKMLIDSFSIFGEEFKDYKLIIYGEGSLRKTLEKQIFNLNLSNRVFLPGKVKNVLSLISSCTIFAFTSDYEGVPNSVIEALALGLPVVATDCSPGGVRSLIDDGVNGIIVPVGDVNGFANELKRVASDSYLQKKLSTNAKISSKQYDCKLVLSEWISFLESKVRK